MSRVAIVGVGAVGGALADELARAGHEVVLCCRTPIAALVVERDGIERLVDARVACDPGDVARVDWIVLATKAHQSAAAAPWLDRGEHLAVAQNGVEHRDRVDRPCVPVIVDLSAERVAPGRVRVRRVGTLTVPPDGAAFAELWKTSTLSVEVSSDFVTAAWTKLAWNVASGAITALTRRPMGVVRRDDVGALARGLLLETIAVGRAEGARIELAMVDTMLAAMRAGRPDAAPSLLRDVEAGRALEYDARNGAVARIGARHGIATPLSDAVTALLAAISEVSETSEIGDSPRPTAS